MNWEQKLEALQALKGDFIQAFISMRAPGDWYFSGRLDVGGDGFITGIYGNGATPEAAVLDTWRKLVEMLPSDRWLTPDGGKTCWRWSGYHWRNVTEGAVHDFRNHR